VKPALLSILIIPLLLGVSPAISAEDDGAGEGEPLKITIRPEYDTFDGTFTTGAARDATRLENTFNCPRDQILSCDISWKLWGPVDRIQTIVATSVFQKYQDTWQKPALGMIMGGKYAKLPDYMILASFGIDPGLNPLDPYPQPTGEMYGSLWFAAPLDLADRMAGPVMLAKNSKTQVDRLNGNRGLCIGVC